MPKLKTRVVPDTLKETSGFYLRRFLAPAGRSTWVVTFLPVVKPNGDGGFVVDERYGGEKSWRFDHRGHPVALGFTEVASLIDVCRPGTYYAEKWIDDED